MDTSNEQSGLSLSKAKAFFARAEEVAATDNFDYAIDLYLEGLRRAPDALAEGHKQLRQMALIRQAKGGKRASIVEKMKPSLAKTPLDKMLAAEYLLAKDPEHLGYAETMLRGAVAGGYVKVTEWVADLIFEAVDTGEKQSLGTLLLLKEAYAKIGLFEKAVAACQCAVKLKPDDGVLQEELKNLFAQLTVQKGKYGQGADFRGSIKDREEQEKLQSQESVVKTEEYRVKAVESAREALAQNPELAANITRLANALSDMQNDKSDNEAIELLEKAYVSKKDFSFERYAGEIRIKQIRRKLRAAKAAVEAEPDNSGLKDKFAELSQQLNQAELEHYRLCVENYPTDMRLRYELGLRLMRNKQYDDAIPMFQEAQRNPASKIAAMNETGTCFFMKGWFADAIDIFSRAMDSYEIKDDAMAKQLRYNLGRSYEQQGDRDKALEVYRKLAQIDYAFKDVRQRVDKLMNINRKRTS